MLLTYCSRDRRTLHLTLHVHDHSGVVLEVNEDALLPVPRLPLTDHHHAHHLLPEHKLALLHRTHTVMMARFLSPLLSAQFMTPIPTLILNLTSSCSLSWTSSWSLLVLACASYQLQVRSFPQWSLFSTRCGSALFICCELTLCSRLSGPVSAPRRRHLRAPNSQNLCNVRPWLRQGLSCPRADPRVHHRTFSHVLRQNFPSEAAHHTPGHRLSLAEPPHTLSRATRGLGEPSPTLKKTPPPPGTVCGDK